MKRVIRWIETGMMLLLVPFAVQAQGNYPSQPVRAIVTTAAGGGLDNFARMLIGELSTRANALLPRAWT